MGPKAAHYLRAILVSPPVKLCSPGKTCAKGREYKQISFVNFISKIPQSQRYGSCRGIAEFLNVNQYFFLSKTHSLCGGIYDSQICLVRYKICNIISLKIVSFHNLRRHIRHSNNCMSKYLLAFLMDIVHSLSNCLFRSWIQRTSSNLEKILSSYSVNMKNRIQQSIIFIFTRFYQHCNSCISKKRTSATVLVISDSAHSLCADV